MRRRAFTLIEVMIVVAILGILAAPFGALVVSQYRSFKSLAMMASLRNESDDAGLAVIRLAALGGTWHLDQDNHGIHFSNGNQARWQSATLSVRDHGRARTMRFPEVTDLILIRHGSTLSVTVYVSGPTHPGGPPVATHQTYEYPLVEVLK